MSRILAVGIATLDIVLSLESYPAEDQEVRALSRHQTRGGNATNTLVVLSQLGHRCSWAGVLPKEADANAVIADLDKFAVDFSPARRPSQGKLPVSYIVLAADSGSRSIVHFRDCPEYDFASFDHLTLDDYDWIHFEGRNIEELALMLKKVRQAGIPCSLEVEKPREHIEDLFDLADVLIFSRAYALHKGAVDAESFLRQRQYPGMVFVAWGEEGASCREPSGIIHHAPAPETAVTDSLGAGDVFNAGIIDGLLRQQASLRVLQDAVNLASAQCAREGLVL